jgi:hypothetical protein
VKCERLQGGARDQFWKVVTSERSVGPVTCRASA